MWPTGELLSIGITEIGEVVAKHIVDSRKRVMAGALPISQAQCVILFMQFA